LIFKAQPFSKAFQNFNIGIFSEASKPFFAKASDQFSKVEILFSFWNFYVEQLEVSSSFSQYLYIKNQSSGFSYFSIILC